MEEEKEKDVEKNEQSEDESELADKYLEPKTDENFEYPANYREKFIQDANLPNSLTKTFEIFGLDSSKRYNYYFLNENEILMSIANTFQIFNLTTKERKIFFSTEVGGVGAVTVHPSKKFFAVGECGSFPNIYIFKYEEGNAKLYRILRKGTEQAYSALSFNDEGNYLASVGGDPDYNLVIWNWKTEAIILKAKAFSQEVFRVQFSSLFEEKSITSGMGHIKFWEMATTFTGLKLQGELGKFGQIDLSDISAFVEFPDGKVLSGTEHGTFLLWEGIFIKANLDEGEKKKVHEGGLIEHMSWIKNDNVDEIKIMSAAHDGKIKWWKYVDFENVTLDDFSNGVVHPIREVQLINPVTKRPVKIMNLVKTDNFWLIQDGNGFLVKVTPSESDDNFPCEVLFECHAGKILSTAFEPKMPLLVSVGADEKISFSTYHSNMLSFPERLILEEPDSHTSIYPTCSQMPSREITDNPYIIPVGYSNGLFKIFTLIPDKKKIELVFTARPHKEAIQMLKISPDETYLLTATKDEIFFFMIHKFDNLEPLFCIQKEDIKIVDIDWHPDSKRILVGYSNGTLEEITVPTNIDNTTTYMIKDYPKKEMKLKKAETEIEKIDEKKRQRQKEQGKLKEDPEPGTIFSCKYMNVYGEDDFIVTGQKPYNDGLYLCNFNFSDENVDNRPINVWKLAPDNEYYIKHISKNYLFIAEHKGALQIRNRRLLDKCLEIQGNLPGIEITSLTCSDDEKFISIGYADGVNVINALNTEEFENLIESPGEEVEAKEFPEIKLEKKTVEQCLTQLKKGDLVGPEEEVDAEKVASIEDAKQKKREDEKMRIADEKKEKLKKVVQKLRDDFKKLKDSNDQFPEEVRLTAEELKIDDNYLKIVEEEQKLQIKDVEAKYEWLKANIEVSIEKIKSFFLSSVQTGKSIIYSFRTGEHVSTIRCPALPEDFEEKIKVFEDELEEFQRKTDFDSLVGKYQEILGSNEIDQQKELQKIESLIELGNQRTITQTERKEQGQLAIEEEIEATKSDISEMEEYLLSKKKKSTKAKKETQMQMKGAKKNLKVKKIEKEEREDDRNQVPLIPCPDMYNLKIKGDKIYSEKNMLINSKHLRRIYKFLKLLYDEREKYNKKLIDLKELKITIINKLDAYKKEIEEYNDILEVKEDYDWYHFENKDTTEDLTKIPQKDLDEYIKTKIQNDTELKAIYEEDQKEQESKKLEEEDQDEEWNFKVEDRHNKQVNASNLENEKRILDEFKYNYLKTEKLKEINKEIDSFDEKVERLKNERILISLIQKLGEYELLIKQKELNKLRAYELDDKQIIAELYKLFEGYEINLSNLNNNRTALKSIEEDKKLSEAKIKEIDDEFMKLIENETGSREDLIKFYNRKSQKDENGEDKEEDEITFPKSMANKSLKEDIKAKAENKKVTRAEIEKLENKIKDNEKKKVNEIENKKRLDERKAKFLDRINTNEINKSKYMNQIELAMPVISSNFSKINPHNGKTIEELGKTTIFINMNKINELNKSLNEVQDLNGKYTKDNQEYNSDRLKLIGQQNDLKEESAGIENEFKNEQILKFGLEIKFDKLLLASKKTTEDKFEKEYRKLKNESNRMIEAVKNQIDRAKAELNNETKINTEQLKEINKNLKAKQENDNTLEAKNSEITKKNNKKYAMVDLKNKKQKLKDIMKLLKQQMEALKQEIDIFKRKGGHIYSTIASNLV